MLVPLGTKECDLMPIVPRASACGLVLAFAIGAPLPAHLADGTYSLDMSGAVRTHVSGRATGRQSSQFSDAGQSYSIVLHLPKGTAPGDPSGEEFLVFSAQAHPAPGQYAVADPGDDRPKTLATVLSGRDETPWSTAGGRVDIAAGKSAQNGRSGVFTIKFVKLNGMKRPVGATDTLFVSGKFEIP
jgi:hypothetical protein